MEPAGEEVSADQGDVGGTAVDPPVETRIALGEALAWGFQSSRRDSFIEHRPDRVECERGTGWLVEEDALEIRTDSCNYASLTQESLLNIPAGTTLELALSHSDLIFGDAAEAHVALTIAGVTVWEQAIAIPSDSAVIREDLVLDFDIAQRDSIELHLHNHGSNAWTIHGLDAILPGDVDPDAFCPRFDSTFQAIQATVFEQSNCTDSLCHSSDSSAGGLDLSTEVAHANLIDVMAVSSPHLLVNPRSPSESFLYQKLSAKTFPGSYDIAGSPMPSTGEAISVGQLEAIRLWIEAGAPADGSVGDTLGRGEDEIERLLGVCLPEARAINVAPLPPPEPELGVQFEMPAHEILAESEREICFAVYEDFRDQVPLEYMDASQSVLYTYNQEVREDPFTHHNVLFYAGVPMDLIHDPSFGAWTCAGGEQDGMSCEPTDTAGCGAGQCRSEMKDSVACQGYGPTSGRVDVLAGVNRFSVGLTEYGPGFYEEIPTHGIFYWNSHAFNLTTDDAMHGVWRNLYFADDLRFKAERVTDSRHIYAGVGTPPFTRQEVCREHILDQGDALVQMASHTHKRGEKFTVALKGSDPFYTNLNYDEPLIMNFSPPWEFPEADVESRTLVYCAVYNNGLNPDDSFNVDTVTRKSQKPARSFCTPTHCAEGNVGASCSEDDHSACDSSVGAGDGLCDACPISAGITSDDEMFVLIAGKVANFAEVVANQGPQLQIKHPLPNRVFAPGDTFSLSLELLNFTLEEPEAHGHDGGHMSDHNDAGGDHSQVNRGHYHVYLDEDDDSAPHVTEWATILEYTLPADIAPGEHEIRVSLRAPDHHPIGVEASVIIIVQG